MPSNFPPKIDQEMITSLYIVYKIVSDTKIPADPNEKRDLRDPSSVALRLFDC